MAPGLAPSSTSRPFRNGSNRRLMQIGEMVWLSIWEIVAKAIGLGAPPARHAALTVLEVSFKGNHKIDKDTLGEFATPEWLLGRAEQFPVCYTRGKKIKLTVKFKVV